MNASHRFLTKHRLLASALLGLVLFTPITIKAPPNLDTEQDRSRGQIMLDRIKEDLEQNYYDPSFHGMNLDARFSTAKERIRRAASVGEIFGIIVQVLIQLLEEIEHFCGCGQQEVAKIVQCGVELRALGYRVVLP